MKISKIIVFGASGMLGHTIFSELLKNKLYITYGTTRSFSSFPTEFFQMFKNNLYIFADILNEISIGKFIDELNPSIIINCIGIVKQLPQSQDALTSIKINALFPHILQKVCSERNIRLIHFSTDCVFDGKKGKYRETDKPTPDDLYGRTKLLGEVTGSNSLTIRTSIIGHELQTKHSLVEWFLSQRSVQGYKNAIYSGIPTIELAHILDHYVLPDSSLRGVFNIASHSISKYDLLFIIRKVYKRNIDLRSAKEPRIDRSLISKSFENISGYKKRNWRCLINTMYRHYNSCPWYK